MQAFGSAAQSFPPLAAAGRYDPAAADGYGHTASSSRHPTAQSFKVDALPPIGRLRTGDGYPPDTAERGISPARLPAYLQPPNSRALNLMRAPPPALPPDTPPEDVDALKQQVRDMQRMVERQMRAVQEQQEQQQQPAPPKPLTPAPPKPILNGATACLASCCSLNLVSIHCAQA